MKKTVRILLLLSALLALSSALALPALAAVDDHTHSYKLAAVRKEPTCTASGTGLYRCEVCGHQEMRDIPALGHKWSAWKTTKAATCAKAGTQTRTCSRCGEKQTKSIAATGHTYEWKVTKKATCGTAGSRQQVCSVCGAKGKTETIKATGQHTYEWKVTRNATCGADGTRQQVCKVCGAKGKTETIPATGKHTWTKWTITKAPTCKAAGEQSRSCSGCGEKQTKVAPKTDEHTFGAWTVTQAASCEQAGEEKRACGLCGKEESRAIDALGHDWDKGVTTVPAGYLETGVKTYTCARCGATKTEEVPVNATMNGGSIMDQLRNIPPDAGSQDELRIVTQPVGGTIDHEGGSLTLTVEAAGGTPPYTYQWRGMSSVTDWPFWFNVENGTDSTLEVQKGNRRYYCQVYDAKGNHVDSAKVQVTYNLYIAQQPENTATCEMDPVILTCKAAGGVPSENGTYIYAWYTSAGEQISFSDQGATEVPGPGEYYCMVQDNGEGLITSKTVTVYDADPFEAKTDAPVVELLDGQDYVLWARAYGGIEPYTGVWMRDGVEIPTQPGENGEFTAPILGDGSKEAVYTFLATDAMEDTASCTVKVVYPQLKIARQPQGGTLYENGVPHIELQIVMEEGVEPFRYTFYMNGEKKAYGDSGPEYGFRAWESGQYYIHVEDADGGWADSNIVIVSDYTFKIDHIDKAGPITNASAGTKLTAVVEGGVEPITYGWWYIADDGTGDQLTKGYESSFLATRPGKYLCYAEDRNKKYDRAEIQVEYTGTAPIITKQPECVTKRHREEAGIYSQLFTCEAITYDGRTDCLAYQWEKKEANGWQPISGGLNCVYWQTDSNDAKKIATYHLQGARYRCIVTDTRTGEKTTSQDGWVYIEMMCAISSINVYASTPILWYDIDGGTVPYQVKVYQHRKVNEDQYMEVCETTRMVGGEYKWPMIYVNPQYSYIVWGNGEYTLKYASAEYYLVVTDAAGNVARTPLYTIK